MSLKYLFIALFFFQYSFCFGQFSLQTNIGIENPYKYVYTVNVSPSPSTETFVRQEFKFFRTKIASIGITYDYTLPILKERLSFNVGTNLGYMHQFVADTIVSPTQVGLLYNVRHKNVFFAPEIGVNVKLYKFISFTSGVELFIPLRKWIHAEQETLVFRREYSELFYTSAAYYSLGLEFDFNKFKVGLKFQGSGETDNWIEIYPFKYVYWHHDLQRWMICLKYEL